MEIVIEYILEKHQLKPVSSNMKKLKQREAKGFTQNDGRVNTQHSSVEQFLLGCFLKKNYTGNYRLRRILKGTEKGWER